MLTITDYIQHVLTQIAEKSCQFEENKIDFVSTTDHKIYTITIEEIEEYEWE